MQAPCESAGSMPPLRVVRAARRRTDNFGDYSRLVEPLEDDGEAARKRDDEHDLKQKQRKRVDVVQPIEHSPRAAHVRKLGRGFAMFSGFPTRLNSRC